jgi:UDPglucose--hexose-1-phosphate uridylyltransferase
MSTSNELRQNVLTGHWIAVAPNRGDRPRFDAEGGVSGQRDDCPFCPGNEAELPSVLAEVGQEGPTSWRIRVVPNRYPAFTNDAGRGEWVDIGLGQSVHLATGLALGSDVPVRMAGPLPAVGYQEVIIETPEHGQDLPDMAPDELAGVVDAYHARYLAVSESAPSCRVFLFRNRGRAAGTSIPHAHAQLIATTSIPPEVRVREIRMLGYHNDFGRCLLCSLPEIEPGWAERLVLEDESFQVFVPWAAETPHELWVVPRRHQAEFGEATAEERRALALILGEALRLLRDRADDPPYNLMIHSPRRSRSGSQAFHWFVQIRPRTGQSAGFELASGISINASSPEADARWLRGEGVGERARDEARGGRGIAREGRKGGLERSRAG